MFALDRPEIADAGTDVSSDHVGVRLIDLETAVFDGFVGGGHCEVRERTHTAGFLLIEKAERIKAFNFARELYRKLLSIKPLDVVDTRLTTHQRGPRSLDCIANRRNQAEACDHNPTCQINAP